MTRAALEDLYNDAVEVRDAPTCGGLFDGAGLLAWGLHRAGWRHSWLCESDLFRRGLLRTRFPGAVVYDDVRTVRGPFAANADGNAVRDEPVGIGGRGGRAVAGRHCEAAPDASRDAERRPGAATGTNGQRTGSRADNVAERVTLIAGGFPCRGASTAGKREGFDNAETVLWGEFRRLISELRPRYVIIENVENILGMASRPGQPRGSLWGTVLAEMAALGFDVRWDVLPAASVGAPHLRERVFAVGVRRDGSRDATECAASTGEQRDAVVADADEERESRMPERGGSQHARLGTGDGFAAHASDTASERTSREGGHARGRYHAWPDIAIGGQQVDWGEYGSAVRRWEAIHGEAPAPLISRLRGMDDGDPELQRVRLGLDRSEMRTQRQRLSALGDGVHCYIGWVVGEYIMSLERERLAAGGHVV